mgnify:CR=1 FL=1
MKILLILLLFFWWNNVSAKTITTPFQKVGEVNSTYEAKSNEKIEKVTYYKQEKIDKAFKYLEEPNDEYQVKSDEISYGKYSSFRKEKLNADSLDEDIKTIYYYNALKKIDSLTLKDIKNLLITKITLKYKDKTIYEGTNQNIKLSKKYSPEYLTLDITCFLNQGDIKGSFRLVNSNYINEKISVTKKGYNKIELRLINHLTKTLYDEKVLKTSNIEDKFYIKVISKENLYRYRKKYYKCYKNESLTDTSVHDGYKVTDTVTKYYLYRKETIEVYDNIKLSNYLDLSKIIKTSTIPLSKLEFNYSNTCSKTILTIKYQDFKENIDVTFNCETSTKSNVHKGKIKSIKRELLAFLFKTLFLRKL